MDEGSDIEGSDIKNVVILQQIPAPRFNPTGLLGFRIISPTQYTPFSRIPLLENLPLDLIANASR